MTNEIGPHEIGSEFHWLGVVQDDNFLPWPEPCLWMATARDAIVAVWQASSKNKKVLYVPEYFCEDVTTYWRNCGISLQFYPDNPSLPSPNWNGLNPHPGDIVLAVNYFGIRDGGIWKDWHSENPDVILVEDHSHDPCSRWSLNSQADYAFASIRKTFPVADGGILWSPCKHPLPDVSLTNNWDGSIQKLAAMILKKEYLSGSKTYIELKPVFRRLQIEGEHLLTTTAFASISPWSRALLEAGFPVSWRKKRSHNVRHFIDRFRPFSNVKFLFEHWVENEQCPFNPIIVFPTEDMREYVRLRLIEEKIYPAIHWKLDRNVSEEALSLSSRIMTIPLDQRYSEHEVDRCVQQLTCLVDG